MPNTEYDNIITKFLAQQANLQELEKLEEWLKQEENINVFNNLIRTQYLITIAMKESDLEEGKLQIKNRLKAQRKAQRLQKIRKWSIAASFAFLIGLALYKVYPENEQTQIVETSTKTNKKEDHNKATLTLGTGEEVILGVNTKKIKNTVLSNGEALVYSSTASDTENIKYNVLTVPRGGQFSVVLNDGTKIWLNSQSQIRYPETFDSNMPRKVQLLYGEAYFDVSPSTENNGTVFKVLRGAQEIEVVGTEFNVKAYGNENVIKTTLVEGAVIVTSKQKVKNLKPGQQSVYSEESDDFKILDVDVYNEISWRKGLFSFDDTAMEEIAEVLSRWYDIDFTFENNNVRKIKFNGVFNKNTSLDNLLKIMENTNEVKFQIYEEKVIIK